MLCLREAYEIALVCMRRGSLHSFPRYSKANHCMSSPKQGPGSVPLSPWTAGEKPAEFKSRSKTVQPLPGLFSKPQLLFRMLVETTGEPIEGGEVIRENNWAKKPKLTTKKISRQLFQLRFFHKEGEMGQLENNCTGPSIFSLLSFSVWKAIGQSCEKLHKVQQKVGGSPPPLNNLPFGWQQWILRVLFSWVFQGLGWRSEEMPNTYF